MKSQYLLICVIALSMLTVSVMSAEFLFGGNTDNFSQFLEETHQTNRRRSRYSNTRYAQEEEEEATADEESAEEAPAEGGDAPAGGLLQEGWLKISSIEFLDFTRNPAVPMTDGSLKGVEVSDSESGKQTYFRDNSQFGADPEIKDKNQFYFRLSGHNIYYTESKTDMRVLGAIAVKNIKSVGGSQVGDQCFMATNSENDTWDLCAADSTTRGQWIDAISKALGIAPPTIGDAETKVVKEEVLIKQPIIMMAQPSPFCNANWNYVQHGTEWNCKCSEGNQQSPIPVPSEGQLLNKSAIFSFNQLTVQQLSIVNEDSIIKVKSSNNDEDFSFGQIIDIDYTEYACKEVHFHTPSEHTVGGKEYPMEIQVMCDPTTEGDMKKKAVISFMVENRPGGSNRFLDRFDFLDLPNQIVWQKKFPNPPAGDNSDISLDDFWRVEVDDTFHGYFTYVNYMGSLTSPPCQEETKWFMVEQPLNLGIAALEMFKSAITEVPQSGGGGKLSVLASDLAPRAPDGNTRNMQDATGRQFFKFDLTQNDCYPKPEKKEKIYGDGHYEKVEKHMTTFIYTPSNKATGLPGALVVTKEEATGKDLETADSNQ